MTLTQHIASIFTILALLAILSSYYWYSQYMALEERILKMAELLNETVDAQAEASQREQAWADMYHQVQQQRDRAMKRLEFERSIRIPGSIHYRN